MSIDTPAVGSRVEHEAAPARERIGVRRLAIARTDIILAVAIFVFALVPRIAWVAYNDREPQGLNDPALYMAYGGAIANGEGYINFYGQPVAYYPVGYPAMVGALMKGGDIFGWGRDVLPIKMANAVWGALTSALIFLLATRVAGRRVGIAAGLIHAVFPGQVFYTGTVLSEPQFTMLLVLALLVLLWHPLKREGMGYGHVFAVGLILSAATMTRGITLIFPLLILLVWLFWMHDRKRALLQTAVMFAGIAVLILPWSVRNTIQMGTLSGPSTNLGDDLCIGNYEGASGRFTITGKCFEGFEGLGGAELEVARNRHGTRVAIEDTLRNLDDLPRLVMYKAYYLLFTDADGLWAAESYGNDYFISQPRRAILAFAANAVYYGVGFIAILGAAAFALSSDIRRLIILLTALYVLAVPLGFFGDPRFHFPAIPFIIIIAASMLIWLWDHRKPTLRREAAT